MPTAESCRPLSDLEPSWTYAVDTHPRSTADTVVSFAWFQEDKSFWTTGQAVILREEPRVWLGQEPFQILCVAC